MRVAKWGNSLAIRLPAAVVDALQLKEGDEIEVRIADGKTFEVNKDRRRELALSGLRKLRRNFPDGFVFHREEEHER